ncbi:MAG: metallophosphoesterase family protein [Gammaproteobacteria bacterium]|jgi:acid phosphatase type 7|nr:metallophosphoesterase family protein [Gammaproteobacteria bacterium]MBT5203410.1 metallophosphoesterase family protein [Gammaproteobacteria bacterium]MBT5602644.1 metallophosphoesterase family protein [Gammaproteobacteria bacterium]MBT6245633.1 metallophosphoesterase family protein [Gammaproteobacteria bacterium]
MKVDRAMNENDSLVLLATEPGYGFYLPWHHCILALAVLAMVIFVPVNAQPAETACTDLDQPTSRLFLQQVSDHSAIIKWRGPARKVCFGLQSDQLAGVAEGKLVDGHYQVSLTGLEADTAYYYTLGGSGSAAVSHFNTAPKPGQLPADGNIHIWLLGDSGTETEVQGGHPVHQGEALEVLDGFLKYNEEQAVSEPLDLILLLGDNAYLDGTDEQWQGAYFDIYTDLIDSTATWPTIGNHEMGGGPLDICLFRRLPQCEKGPLVSHFGGISRSSNPDSYDSNGDGPDPGGLPYLKIFTLPSKAEQGGVASGTEQYYSFGYGNVHVVSLDSQLSNRDPVQRLAMRDWLIDDLNGNTLDWTVVIFHHPPYSKGQNHDSDVEQNEIDMRQTFAPVFEAHGVDVVYSGHAHSYERSWYLNGHHGLSDTFKPSVHTETDSQGKPLMGQGKEAYQQISSASSADDKAVYTVAGSSGKADKENPCAPGMTLGCSLPNWLAHPAHRTFTDGQPGHRSNGLSLKGSVVLDANRHSLTSRFIDENGQVLDYFTIVRDGS